MIVNYDCMQMAIKARVFLILVKTFIILSFMLSTSYVNGTATDIQCLLSIKQSLEDPLNYLSTWNFDNRTEGFICKFTGVDCWTAEGNRVLNLKLNDMGLKGKFPLGIVNCTSLTGLDLFKNDLTGPMPSDIDKIIPFITYLDLSSNGFSGKIPEALANCTYLSVLNLQNNQFSGQIPQQLGLLNRIKTINFANNFLSGPVPTFDTNYYYNSFVVTRESYANNTALCGAPLESCKENGPEDSEISKQSFVVGFVVGWAISVVSVITAFRFYSMYRDKKRGKNMKLTMPMTTALIVRRENKKKEATEMRELSIVEHGIVNHGDENTRDEIIEEMNS